MKKLLERQKESMTAPPASFHAPEPPTDADAHPPPGVRPSPGAASFDEAGVTEHADAAPLANVAAPGDGRTPGQARGCAPPSTTLERGLNETRQARRQTDAVWFDLALFGVGCLLPYAITCLVLWRAGVFHQFVFWTIAYASRYASTVPASYGVEVLKNALDVVVGSNLLLWLLPVAGLAFLWWKPADANHDTAAPASESTSRASGLPLPSLRFFLLTFLAASFASVSVGFHFRNHYFITLLPALSLLTGVAVSRGWLLLRHGRRIELFQEAPVAGGLLLALGGIIVALFAFSLPAALIGNGWVWFASPTVAEWNIFGTTMFAEAAKLGEFLGAQTSKDTRIAVVGSEPEIYFFAHRPSATGYIYTYPLMEKQDLALKMQQAMIAEIEKGKPEYVVYVKDNLSWLRRRFSEPMIFDWWDKYWAAHLDLVNTIKIDQIDDAPGSQPDRYLLVLKRKPDASAKP